MKTDTLGTREWSRYSFNFTNGCSADCSYCYAKNNAARFNRIPRNKWRFMNNRSKPSFKINRHYDGVIMTPTSHDLTPKNVDLAIKYYTALLQHNNQLLIVSKPNPNVILKLQEALTDYKNQIVWRFSITTLDDQVRRHWEPGAPAIKHRLFVLETMFNRGWTTSVSIEPFLDSTVVDVVIKVKDFVREKIWIGPMNKIHVPNELWTAQQEQLYSPGYLQAVKDDIDALQCNKVCYKDTFLNNLPGAGSAYGDKSISLLSFLET